LTRLSLTPWGAIEPRFAIGLGCEIKYARRLVYAKRLDLTALDASPSGSTAASAAAPPGRSARRAPRQCARLLVDESMRSISPFTFKDV